MTDTTTPLYPDTPAAVAAAVLDAIALHPGSLHMGSWASLPDGDLAPGDPVQCGTTMCIAGWAAHLTGYTLCADDEDPGVYAFKDGEEHEVEDVGTAALGLDHTTKGLFWLPASAALAALREIAGR